MKKVLFIIPSLNTGGTNSSLSNIYLYIKDKCAIDIFSLSENRNSEFAFDEDVLPTHKFLTIFEKSLVNANGLAKILPFVIKSIIKLSSFVSLDLRKFVYKKYANKLSKNKHYDYVIGFQEGSATKFASVFECPNKIAWVHCDYNYYLKRSLSELEMYMTFKRIICVSKYTSSIFKERYPKIANKTSFIYNILDEEKIRSRALADIEDPRFINKKFTFLSAGRIDPIKGYDLIPSIASTLKRNNFQFSWYIIGPQLTKKYADRILQLIRDNEVEDCVFWLGNKTNPYPYIKASNAFVCTSISEACPMVFCEAFTLGVPVITTNFGSSVEFIQNKVNGVIASSDKLCDCIKEILSDQDKWRKMADNLTYYESFNKQIKKDLLKLLEL